MDLGPTQVGLNNHTTINNDNVMRSCSNNPNCFLCNVPVAHGEQEKQKNGYKKKTQN